MKFSYAGLLLIASLLGSCRGQAKVEGRLEHSPSFAFADPLIDEAYNLPPQDNLKILENAIHEDEESGLLKPYKFGEAIPFSLDIAHDGHWSVNEGSGLVTWRAMISSQGASSLSINFNKFHLPAEGELYVLSKSEVAGAFTAAINNNENNEFAISPMEGDTIILEYVQPLPPQHSTTDHDLAKSALKIEEVLEEVKRGVMIEVESVVHGFRSVVKRSGNCNINAVCPLGDGFRDQIRSIGIMTTDKGQRYCSGALINNGKQDGRQLFLTAAHCVVAADTTRYMVGFNYQTEECALSNENPSMDSVYGLRLLAKYDKSDFAVFEIIERIPDSYNVFYAGWSRLDQTPRNVTGIHHPSGDVKKISRSTETTGRSAWTESPNAYHLVVPRWTEGTTERGSSGSPLFTHDGFIVGHLHGGHASCTNPKGLDLYGRLASDWEAADKERVKPANARLRDLLDPENKGIISMTGSYYNTTQEGESLVKKPITEATITYAPPPPPPTPLVAPKPPARPARRPFSIFGYA